MLVMSIRETYKLDVIEVACKECIGSYILQDYVIDTDSHKYAGFLYRAVASYQKIDDGIPANLGAEESVEILHGVIVYNFFKSRRK